MILYHKKLIIVGSLFNVGSSHTCITPDKFVAGRKKVSSFLFFYLILLSLK